MSPTQSSAAMTCTHCGTSGTRLTQEGHQQVCRFAEVVPVGTPSRARMFRDVVVSNPSRKTRRSKLQVAISTDLDQYVQLDADRLRWLIEDAGPKALRAMEGS